MDSLETTTGSYHFSLDGLKMISKCPLCSETYKPFQATVVEEKDEAQLMHIQCQKCSSSIVVLIVNGPMGLTSIGLITDLSSEDVERFKDAAPLSEHDLLSTHKLLQTQSEEFLKCIIKPN